MFRMAGIRWIGLPPKQDVMFTVFFTVACGHSNLYSIRNDYCRSVVVVVVPNFAASETTNIDIAKRRSSA